MTDDVLLKLDEVLSVLKLAFADEIGKARSAMMRDPVNRAILESLEDGWLGSGDLQRRVSAATDVSDRTVRDRLGELAARGAIRSRGGGRSLEYSRTGVI
jgi:hypothetical protein